VETKNPNYRVKLERAFADAPSVTLAVVAASRIG